MSEYYKTYLQGDPRLFLSEDGSELQFKNGQPIMDQGLENLALISLFSRPGWAGNDLFADPSEKIGSDFEQSFEQPITLSALNDIRDAAKKALDSSIFGKVSADVSNPTADRVSVVITIEPPGQDIKTLLVEKNGENWIAQKLSPANEREL